MSKRQFVVFESRAVREVPASEIKEMTEMYYGADLLEREGNFSAIWYGYGYRRVKTGTLRQVVDWARATHGEEVAQVILSHATECLNDDDLLLETMRLPNYPTAY